MTLDQGGQLTEEASRPIPHSRAEFDWAHDRPPQHRVAAPAAGDAVLYRHEGWAIPSPATVEWVQPPDDVDDPHLWTVQCDEHGRPLLFEGRPLMMPKADPWPVVRLLTRFGRVETREARLRGSAGWLPLDWQRRHRPVPAVSQPAMVAPRGTEPAPAPMGA